MKRKFTVVLLRPDYMAEEYGKDIYTACVEADSIEEAMLAAREQVLAADDGAVEDPDDYHVLLIFVGHHLPVYHGF
jgi:hypothetical protein